MVKPETELYRQVSRSWLGEDGEPTSQAFKPTKKDEGLLSVYDGDKIKEEDAWDHYTQVLGLNSAGILRVSCGECQQIDLQVRPDPKPHPAHAVIDFSGFSRNAIQKKAKALLGFALERAWRYPRPEEMK